jgi:hypothetical protein
MAPWNGKSLWAGYEIPANVGYNGTLDRSITVMRRRLIGGSDIVPVQNRDQPGPQPPKAALGSGIWGAYVRWRERVSRNG